MSLVILDLMSALLFYLITALVGLLTALVIYARWNYGTLEKIKGLAVIKPAFIGGSDTQIHKKVVHLEDMKNVKKYGRVFGYYEGSLPTIYVADVDMIRHILVKDFDHFQNKKVLETGDKLGAEILDFLPYKKWKVVRNFLSPDLSTGKIKGMSSVMNEVADEWIASIKKRLSAENIKGISKEDFSCLTLDVIARSGYGLKIKSMDDPNNEFVKQVQDVISFFLAGANFMLPIIQTFPFVSRILTALGPNKFNDYFRSLITSIIASRKQSQIEHHDFTSTLKRMHDQTSSEEFRRLGITEETVCAQAIGFLAAGQDTGASTMSMLAYQLAKDPEVQDRAHEEVDAYLSRHNGKVEHETLGELTYLWACLQETLRLHSTLVKLDRVCTKEWTYEPTGLTIPEGMVVEIPVFAVHMDEEYFREPEEFNPDRFLPENKGQLNKYAFLGFGLGNHNCIGMRLAKETMLIAMTKILKTFRFKATADTKIVQRTGQTFAYSVEKFTVGIEPRNEQ